jgi:magnesium transporter
MEAREHTQSSLQLLREQLDSGGMRAARLMVHSLHPSEIAHLLESMPLHERAVLWEMVDSDDEGDVLVEVSDEVRDGLIKGMKTEQLIAAVDGMELDDLADLLIDLPETVTQQVLQSLDDQDEERLRQVLAYDEESAGGLMNVDIVTVRPDVTLEVVCRYLRVRGEMSGMTRHWSQPSCRRTTSQFPHIRRRPKSCGSLNIVICYQRQLSTTTTVLSVVLRSMTLLTLFVTKRSTPS